MSPTASRIPSLDGLRALSILFVIAGHLAGPHEVMHALANFGVHVFFVISGYLITNLLQKEQDRNGRIELSTFYRRRSFRIFPAAFVYIGFVALLAPAARPDLAYALTYTTCYQLTPASHLLRHLWSLSVEEQFYLLWPLALVVGFRYRGRTAMAAMLIAALFRLACTMAVSGQTPRFLHAYFPSVMDSLAAGCLLAIYEPGVRKRCARLTRHGATAPGLLALTFTLAFVFWRNTFVGDTRFMNPGMAVLWGLVPLCIALTIFVAIERQPWILNNPISSAIGVQSYSLYLWQQPFTLGGSESTATILVMVAGFTFVSYALIEEPMIRLGKSLNARQPKPLPILRSRAG